MASSKRFPIARLWLVVTILWTAATVIRISREWPAVLDWRTVITGHWLWISLILPPALFAIILLAIRTITRRDACPRPRLFCWRRKGHW